MKKSRKILTAIVSFVLVVGMIPLGMLSGLFNDGYSFKVSAQENTVTEKPLLTIGTIGDPHADYGLQNVDPYIRTAYITAMDALKAEGIDLLLVGGDMTSDNEAGTDVAFRWTTEVYDRTISQYHKYSAAASSTGKTLWACGNHDYEVGALYDSTTDAGDYDAYKGFTDMMVEDCGEPISLYTQSMDSSAPSTPFGDFWLGAHYIINGFDFIVINSPYHRSTFYTTGTLNWLDETLAKIGKEKTVFITGHYPLYDNRGLHSLADGLREENYTNFVNVLEKYDNAIYLYGHEHGGRAKDQLCDSIYSTVDTFERITHYDSEGNPVTSRATNPTSFITAFMGSASFYNYSLNPNWLAAADPEIIQAMTITVYRDRIVFKMINCGKQTGELEEPLVWSFKRDVLSTGDVVIPESPESWDLPMNWSVGTLRDSNCWDIPVMGNWSIRGFTNLDTATAIDIASSKTTSELFGANNNVKQAPRSYLGNNYNESIVQGKTGNNLVVKNGTNGWYVNYDYRWSGTVAKAGGAYIQATADKGQDGAIVFTAPTTGYYSYYELLKSANLVGGAEYRATVRKNGVIIDSFTTSESGVMKAFEGKVALNAGDMLMFAFEQTTDIDQPNDDAARCFNILRITVTKVVDVAPEVNFVENENQWTMPYDWVTNVENDAKGWQMPYQGAWKLLGYTNLDTATPKLTASSYTTEEYRAWKAANGTANNHGKLPGPYLASNANESVVSNATQSTYDADGWYVNWNQRWSGKIFQGASDAMYVIAHGGKPSAVTFTAPSDGLYAFTEAIELLFDKTSLNLVPSFTATVRRNGLVIASFTPETKGDFTTLSGSVVLHAGDVLMFAFQQNTNYDFNSRSVHSSNDPNCLKIKNVVVTKISDLPDNYKGETEIPMIFNGTSFSDKFGMFTLMGYNTETGAPYSEGLKMEVIDGIWYAYEPKGTNSWTGYPAKDRYLWYGKVNGDIDGVGGHLNVAKYGSTIAFTAPSDGIYEITATMKSAWPNTHSAWSEYLITKEDGTVLAIVDNEGKANGSSTTVSLTVNLAADETVYIIRRPKAGSTKFNVSCEGEATVSVKALDHVCTGNSLVAVRGVEPDCVNGGIADHYVCFCGATYADVNALNPCSVDLPADKDAHAPNSAWVTDINGHWHACDNGCGEKVSYSAHNFTTGTCVCGMTCPHNYNDGDCDYCGALCPHDWSKKDGECALCGVDCPAHDMKNEDGTCVACGMTHTHDWNAETGACKICELVHAHDVTAQNATCVAAAVCSCGYTYPINPNNHVSNEFTYTVIDGVTHKVAHKCCGTEAPDCDCVYGNDNICDNCGYDKTVEVETNDLQGAINNIVNGTSNSVTVVGPTGTMADDYVVEKIEGVAYEYKYFNIAFDDEDNFFLRHHIVCEGALTVTVNGTPVELKSESANVYYFDTYYEAGQFHVGKDIVINGDAYNVSLYSYIKLALEGEIADLDASEETFLRALYDLNEALR